MKALNSLLSCLLAGALLTACGGGGGGGGGGGDVSPPVAEDPVEVPPSADDSVAAYTAFTQTLVATAAETTEPLGLDQVTITEMTVSETDEPIRLD